MAAPEGCVTCALCQAAVSLRAGTLEKLKLHMETDHDAFFQHDILTAINFLEDHEKEVIIEKVLPRMKLQLETAKQFNKKGLASSRLEIETRLLELQEDDSEDEVGSPEKKARYGEEITVKPEASLTESNYTDILGEDSEELDESEVYDDADVEDSFEDSKTSDVELQDKMEHTETVENKEEKHLEEPTEENSPYKTDKEELIKSIMENRRRKSEILENRKKISEAGTAHNVDFVNCEICSKSVRKSFIVFHRKKFHPSPVTKNGMQECSICHKEYKKGSMSKHKRRCVIVERSRIREEEIKAKANETANAEKLTETEHENVEEEEEETEETLEESIEEEVEELAQDQQNIKPNPGFHCDVVSCDKIYTKMCNLSRHRKSAHPA